MRQAMDVDQERRGSSVDSGLEPDRFIDAQYRKTELQRLYRDTVAADRVGKLVRAIEQDVIPRLVSARYHAVDLHAASDRSGEVDADQVTRFARMLLGHEVGGDPSGFVEQVRADGVPIEAIYLDLLAPAARYVGRLWEEDLCTFVDVTLALGTLHRILLSLSNDAGFEAPRIDPARRILLVQPVGSTHTFGLRMVAEFFRRGAWSVEMASTSANRDIGALARAEWFTVIGFSVACDPRVSDLAATIRDVRDRSANPDVGILVGGPAFVAQPELASLVGSDGMAVDAIQAVLEAERFVLHVPAFPSGNEAEAATR